MGFLAESLRRDDRSWNEQITGWSCRFEAEGSVEREASIGCSPGSLVFFRFVVVSFKFYLRKCLTVFYIDSLLYCPTLRTTVDSAKKVSNMCIMEPRDQNWEKMFSLLKKYAHQTQETAVYHSTLLYIAFTYRQPLSNYLQKRKLSQWQNVEVSFGTLQDCMNLLLQIRETYSSNVGDVRVPSCDASKSFGFGYRWHLTSSRGWRVAYAGGRSQGESQQVRLISLLV